MQKFEAIHSYFTRVSQINGHIETTGDKVESTELVMTTLNGLPRSWDPFIKGLCSRKKLPKFSRVWEECTKEESRLESREEKLSDNEDQALATNVGKRKGKRKFRSQKEDHSPKRSKKFQKSQKNKDPSNIKCYDCQKVGHYLRDCPLLKEVKGKTFKRHHAHVAKEE